MIKKNVLELWGVVCLRGSVDVEVFQVTLEVLVCVLQVKQCLKVGKDWRDYSRKEEKWLDWNFERVNYELPEQQIPRIQWAQHPCPSESSSLKYTFSGIWVTEKRN